MPQLMTKEEIHEFGLQILSRYLEANAYEIEMMHPNMQMFPHVIAKKNGQRAAGVYYCGDGCLPQQGQVQRRRKGCAFGKRRQV